MSDRVRCQSPKCRLHQPAGSAVVRRTGRDVYRGPYGTPESAAKYEAAVADGLTSDRKPPARPNRMKPTVDLVVDELMRADLEFAQQYYVQNGQPTGERDNVRDGLRLVTRRCGSARVTDCGALQLRKVRDALVAAGPGRNVVNARSNRVRRMFKWGVEHDQVEPAVRQVPRAVAPLRLRTPSARATEPVGPLPDAFVDAVLVLQRYFLGH